jgi:hypothetical protein
MSLHALSPPYLAGGGIYEPTRPWPVRRFRIGLPSGLAWRNREVHAPGRIKGFARPSCCTGPVATQAGAVRVPAGVVYRNPNKEHRLVSLVPWVGRLSLRSEPSGRSR